MGYAVVEDCVLATSGIVLSIGLYCMAAKRWKKLVGTCSELSKISQAESSSISGLRSLLSSESSESGSASSKEKLVIVHGIVKSSSDVLVSELSKKKCVFLEQTWASIPYKIEKITSSTKSPFVLSEGVQEDSAVALVYLEGLKHELQLELFKFNSRKYPAYSPEFLVQERMLTVGTKIGVVGVCSLHEGTPQIKPCDGLTFFLTKLTKERIVKGLTNTRGTLFCTGVALAATSVAVLVWTVPIIIRLVRRCVLLWERWNKKEDKAQNDGSITAANERDETQNDGNIENMEEAGN